MSMLANLSDRSSLRVGKEGKDRSPVSLSARITDAGRIVLDVSARGMPHSLVLSLHAEDIGGLLKLLQPANLRKHQADAIAD